MDLGILSSLLGGQQKEGKNISAGLLSLLLGGKNPLMDGVNQSDLFSQLFKGPLRDKEADYPPLFGEEKQGNSMGDLGIMNILKNMNQPISQQVKSVDMRQEYPYELQYNRPDRM